MTDSPAVHAPLDPREKPILESLQSARDSLLLLKRDKSTYVKSQDVLPLYETVTAQVHALNAIRTDKRLEQNRVDYLLDDCFQLISLFFLTVGRNNEAPAVYSMSSTVKRLLDHLKEAAFFSAKDLESIGHTLTKMRETLTRGKESYDESLIVLLNNRLDACEALLDELRASLSTLDPELVSVHETLVSILRSTSAVNTRSKFSPTEVQGLQAQLETIEGKVKDGSFLGDDGKVPEGHEIVEGLIRRCRIWTDMVLERQGKIDPKFAATYKKLVDIRNQLDRLSITQAWSLRETDLYMYQRQLDRVDEARVDGNFLDAEGKPADLHAQRTLLYLLRRSYAYIYALLISSEPVSEALLPIYKQLQTLLRCLVEVKKSGGISSPRELYPYSMKLNSIDNMRTDGKFIIGGDIPEGQGSVNQLLAECYELIYELRASAEEEEADTQTKEVHMSKP